MKYKQFIFIFAFFLILVSANMVSADSSSSTVSWHIAGTEQDTGAISHISPSFSNKVPHIRLGEYLNFKGVLALLNNLQWTTNIIHLVLLP